MLASDAYKLMNCYFDNEKRTLTDPTFLPIEDEKLKANPHRSTVRFFMSFSFDGKRDATFMKVIIPLIDAAKHSVLLFSSIHTPTDEFTQAIERAIKRGVQVTVLGNMRLFHLDIVCQGVLNVYYHLYNQLKATVFIWNNGSFLHSKMATFDEEISYIGSANFDYRSQYLDSNCGCLILSKAVNHAIKQEFNNLSTQYHPYKPKSPSSWDKVQAIKHRSQY